MIKNMTFALKSGRLPLFLGLILALLAAVLTAVYLSSAGGEDSTGASAVATVPVVVAAQNIPAGARIEASMVSVKPVPTDLVIPKGLKKSEEVVGKVASINILAGEQIVSDRIAATTQSGQTVGASTLAEVVPLQKPATTCSTEKCGQRAVSVAVAPLTSSGGQIQPADHVDVVLAFRDGGAITILQDIVVLSIGQELVKVAAGAEGDTQVAQEQKNSEATTATLAVWPDDAQKLTAGEEFAKGGQATVTDSVKTSLGLPENNVSCSGSLRLVLRHTNQQGPVPLETRGACSTLFAYIWGLK